MPFPNKCGNHSAVEHMPNKLNIKNELQKIGKNTYGEYDINIY
jgi:hypothetical protein